MKKQKKMDSADDADVEGLKGDVVDEEEEYDAEAEEARIQMRVFEADVSTICEVILGDKNIDEMDDAPFTIQRICELACSPEAYYSTPYKLATAMLKLFDVTQTVDRRGQRLHVVGGNQMTDPERIARDDDGYSTLMVASHQTLSLGREQEPDVMSNTIPPMPSTERARDEASFCRARSAQRATCIPSVCTTTADDENNAVDADPESIRRPIRTITHSPPSVSG
jgi:hypothetical protein